MDTLPNEIIFQVLSYAMIRDTPFDLSLDDYLDALRDMNRRRLRSSRDCPQPESDPAFKDCSAGHVLTSPSTQSPSSQMLSERLTAIDDQGYSSKSSIYMSHNAEPHLLDWEIAGSVCKRFRWLGKEAFFRNKVFFSTINLLRDLQERCFARMCLEDQLTAPNFITSVMLYITSFHSPGPFVRLPQLVAGFPHLKFLDFSLEGECQLSTETT